MGQAPKRYSFLDLLDDDLAVVTPEDVAAFRRQRVLPDRLPSFLALCEKEQRLLTALDLLDDGVVAEIIRQRCIVAKLHDIKNHLLLLAMLTDDVKYRQPART